MYIDPLYFFAIEITAYVRSFFYNQTSFPLLVSQIGKACSVKACSNNNIVVLLH